MNKKLKFAVAGAGCVLAGVLTLGGLASAHSEDGSGHDHPTSPITQPIGAPPAAAQGKEPKAGLVEIVRSQTPEQREADIQSMPPEQQAGMRWYLEQVANDRVPVSGPNGFIGYVKGDALDAPLPASRADLYPVVNDSGATVAYFAGEIGVVEKQAIESSESLDIVELQRQSRFKVRKQ